jgi:hypothetical protein
MCPLKVPTMPPTFAGPLACSVLVVLALQSAMAQPVAPNSGEISLKHGLGAIAVPGACTAVASLSQQRATNSALLWSAGQAELTARIWPDPRVSDRQRLKLLAECTRAVPKTVRPELLAPLNSEAERLAKEAINQCLTQAATDVRVRSVVLSRSSPVCK